MLTLQGATPKTRPATLPEGAPANLAIDAATEYLDAEAAYWAASARLRKAQDHFFFILQEEFERSLEGEPLTSVDVPTVRGEVLKVVFQERYRSLPPTDRQALVNAFGSEYGNLVEDVEEVRLKPGTTRTELETLLGKSVFARLAPHVTLKEQLRPRKHLVATLQAAFSQGGGQFARDLLELIRSTMSTPQIRLPKKGEKITE
jgi:hypothetical protein